MNILFLTNYKWPHVGGVEKHIYEVSKRLKVKGESVKTISSGDIKYPRIRFFGLLYIWYWLFENRKLIENADIVHCHDVFVWYLPFRFLYPNKHVYTTFHGLEWDQPFRMISILQKKIAAKLSTGNIGIGTFLQKYLKINFDKISFGGTKILIKKYNKSKGLIVYVGRLEKNTGMLKFLDWFRNQRGLSIQFCGDGPLRAECEKYGEVYGFRDPAFFLRKAEFCVPGGYLTALEALVYGCKLKFFWHNKLREDIWKMSPFYQLKGKKLKAWVKQQTWEKLANEYLDLYHNA